MALEGMNAAYNQLNSQIDKTRERLEKLRSGMENGEKPARGYLYRRQVSEMQQDLARVQARLRQINQDGNFGDDWRIYGAELNSRLSGLLEEISALDRRIRARR